MEITNPQFPHTCRIIRYAETEPMDDQANVEDYDPMSDETEGNNEGGEPSASVQSGEVTVVYEGKCRSDNRETVADNGDVIASYRKLQIPMKQDEWTEETIPLEGDRIELQRFGYKEYGTVIDKYPGNLGTTIIWKYVRN